MRRLILSSTCLAMLATPALAKPRPPRPPGGPAAQASWAQAAVIQGTVKAFTLTPVGDIEGIILSDGTEVHVPPHLTAQVAAAVRPGEMVAVRGWRTGVPNFVVATALTGQRGESVLDQGPPPPGTRPPPPPPGQPPAGAQSSSVQGRVQQLLHGPAGDVNGALLDNGTTVKWARPLTWQMASRAQVGQTLTVQGWTLTNGYGRVIDAQALADEAPQTPQGAPPPSPPSAPGAAPPPPPPPAPGGAAPPPRP